LNPSVVAHWVLTEYNPTGTGVETSTQLLLGGGPQVVGHVVSSSCQTEPAVSQTLNVLDVQAFWQEQQALVWAGEHPPGMTATEVVVPIHQAWSQFLCTAPTYPFALLPAAEYLFPWAEVFRRFDQNQVHLFELLEYSAPVLFVTSNQ
jgi:hypothetical protein